MAAESLDDFGDNANDEVDELRGRKEGAAKTTEGRGANTDSNVEVGDDRSRASVVVATGEPGKDGVTRAVEDTEGVLGIGDRPLLNDLGDGAGEGHNTGSEDSEDSRETHDEETLEDDLS